MKIIFKSKDFSITEELKDYAIKRIGTLDKFLKFFDKEIISAEAELGRSTRHHQSGDIFRFEVNLNIGGRMFRAEAEKPDLYSAIDEVRDELEQSVRKFKTKKETTFIRGARSLAKKFRLSPLARFKNQ